jgi:hypothetical protein
MRNMLLVLPILLSSTSTAAASNSWVTLGIGTSLGMSHSTTASQKTASFSGELSLRARLFHLLGFELAWAPLDRLHENDDLVLDSRLRLSLIANILPTTPLGLHLKAGIGGGGFADLTRFGLDTRSFHLGAGIDYHIGENAVVSPEFLFMVPNIEAWSILRDDQPSTSLSPASFFGLCNYRFTLSVRYYL